MFLGQQVVLQDRARRCLEQSLADREGVGAGTALLPGVPVMVLALVGIVGAAGAAPSSTTTSKRSADSVTVGCWSPWATSNPSKADGQYHAAADNINMTAQLTTHGFRSTRDSSDLGFLVDDLQIPMLARSALR